MFPRGDTGQGRDTRFLSRVSLARSTGGFHVAGGAEGWLGRRQARLASPTTFTVRGLVSHGLAQRVGMGFSPA